MLQDWKILRTDISPTSPNVLNAMVYLIINIGKIQNVDSSCSIRHSPTRADEWIFPALNNVIRHRIHETIILQQQNLSYDDKNITIFLPLAPL